MYGFEVSPELIASLNPASTQNTNPLKFGTHGWIPEWLLSAPDARATQNPGASLMNPLINASPRNNALGIEDGEWAPLSRTRKQPKTLHPSTLNLIMQMSVHEILAPQYIECLRSHNLPELVPLDLYLSWRSMDLGPPSTNDDFANLYAYIYEELETLYESMGYFPDQALFGHNNIHFLLQELVQPVMEMAVRLGEAAEQQIRPVLLPYPQARFMIDTCQPMGHSGVAVSFDLAQVERDVDDSYEKAPDGPLWKSTPDGELVAFSEPLSQEQLEAAKAYLPTAYENVSQHGHAVKTYMQRMMEDPTYSRSYARHEPMPAIDFTMQGQGEIG